MANVDGATDRAREGPEHGTPLSSPFQAAAERASFSRVGAHAANVPGQRIDSAAPHRHDSLPMTRALSSPPRSPVSASGEEASHALRAEDRACVSVAFKAGLAAFLQRQESFKDKAAAEQSVTQLGSVPTLDSLMRAEHSALLKQPRGARSEPPTPDDSKASAPLGCSPNTSCSDVVLSASVRQPASQMQLCPAQSAKTDPVLLKMHESAARQLSESVRTHPLRALTRRAAAVDGTCTQQAEEELCAAVEGGALERPVREGAAAVSRGEALSAGMQSENATNITSKELVSNTGERQKHDDRGLHGPLPPQPSAPLRADMPDARQSPQPPQELGLESRPLAKAVRGVQAEKLLREGTTGEQFRTLDSLMHEDFSAALKQLPESGSGPLSRGGSDAALDSGASDSSLSEVMLSLSSRLQRIGSQLHLRTVPSARSDLSVLEGMVSSETQNMIRQLRTFGSPEPFRWLSWRGPRAASVPETQLPTIECAERDDRAVLEGGTGERAGDRAPPPAQQMEDIGSQADETLTTAAEGENRPALDAPLCAEPSRQGPTSHAHVECDSTSTLGSESDSTLSHVMLSVSSRLQRTGSQLHLRTIPSVRSDLGALEESSGGSIACHQLRTIACSSSYHWLSWRGSKAGLDGEEQLSKGECAARDNAAVLKDESGNSPSGADVEAVQRRGSLERGTPLLLSEQEDCTADHQPRGTLERKQACHTLPAAGNLPETAAHIARERQQGGVLASFDKGCPPRQHMPQAETRASPQPAHIAKIVQPPDATAVSRDPQFARGPPPPSEGLHYGSQPEKVAPIRDESHPALSIQLPRPPNPSHAAGDSGATLDSGSDSPLSEVMLSLSSRLRRTGSQLHFRSFPSARSDLDELEALACLDERSATLQLQAHARASLQRGPSWCLTKMHSFAEQQLADGTNAADERSCTENQLAGSKTPLLTDTSSLSSMTVSDATLPVQCKEIETAADGSARGTRPSEPSSRAAFQARRSAGKPPAASQHPGLWKDGSVARRPPTSGAHGAARMKALSGAGSARAQRTGALPAGCARVVGHGARTSAHVHAQRPPLRGDARVRAKQLDERDRVWTAAMDKVQEQVERGGAVCMRQRASEGQASGSTRSASAPSRKARWSCFSTSQVL